MKENGWLKAGRHLKTIKRKGKPDGSIALGNGEKAVFSDNTGKLVEDPEGLLQSPEAWGGAAFYIIDLNGDTEICAWPSFRLPTLKIQMRKTVFGSR